MPKMSKTKQGVIAQAFREFMAKSQSLAAEAYADEDKLLTYDDDIHRLIDGIASKYALPAQFVEMTEKHIKASDAKGWIQRFHFLNKALDKAFEE